ncbi:hypothetical protein QFC21_002206 [Naganishia friedmannii]|uniref:Uncharacterized protein n=1 Tax=Naganishia friedmannii TaxID=89922 RepID=A0ACC2VXB3_9TREE|nr:hypothetical protein QFC21_002206 [Naganishia friedmannii]
MSILLSSAASVTLSSVICNTIGSAILHRIHPHAPYNILWASRNAAVGGAILTIPWMIIFRLLNACFVHSPIWVQEMVGNAGWIVAAAGSAAAGAVGAAVLIASLGEDKVKQGIKESAAAGGVGSGVWLAGLMALACMLGIGMAVVKGMNWILSKIVDRKTKTTAAAATRARESGQHELGQVSWAVDAGVAPSTTVMMLPHGTTMDTDEGMKKTDHQPA